MEGYKSSETRLVKVFFDGGILTVVIKSLNRLPSSFSRHLMGLSIKLIHEGLCGEFSSPLYKPRLDTELSVQCQPSSDIKGKY